jgi:quercetin dioxygenase-like cupin family protein
MLGRAGFTDARIHGWTGYCTSSCTEGALISARKRLSSMEREKVAANWAARGFSCDLWTDPPGQRWENFTHATDELVTVLEGEMEFEVAGKMHRPMPGTELLIPAGKVHSARNIGNTAALWLYGYKHG